MENSEDLFSKICRLCLSVNNSRTVPLFENNTDLSSYGQAVTSSVNIQLPHLQFAPTSMCYNCLRDLRQCIQFQKKCKNAQNFFKNITFNKPHTNVKEDIIKQLYGHYDSLKDNKSIFINRNNYNFNEVKKSKGDSKKSSFTNNKSYVDILFEPIQSNNRKGKCNAKTKNKRHKSSNTIDTSNDNKRNIEEEDSETDCANDIHISNDNDTDYDLLNLMENEIKVKKVEFKKECKKEVENNTFNYDDNAIFNQIEELSNTKIDDKELIKYSKIPTKDCKNNKTTGLNSNLLDIKINSSNSTKNTEKTDVIFDTIDEILNEELLKHKISEKQTKKTQRESMENYKTTSKLIENTELDSPNKTDKNSLKVNSLENKIAKLKEDKLAMKYLKVSKDAKVKFRNLNSHKTLSKKNKKDVSKKIEKPDFKCETCERTFKSKNTWLRHSERHAGITAFMCEQCGKGFVTKSELEVHMVLSHGTGKYYPCQECGYKAPKPYDLKEHMRLHTGERPYACDQCGLTFRRLYIMRQHQICHTEKKFQCPKCPLRFYKLTSLRAHDNNAHARRYMYACSVCGRQYARNKTVRQHLTKVHAVPRDKQGKIARVFISETALSHPPLEVTANITSSNSLPIQ